MNELAKLLSSKNYADVCPDTVKKEYERQLARHGNPKEAEKAARTRLHALTGAFMTQGELKQARKCLEAFRAGDENALRETLLLHASTRERISEIDAFYARVEQFAPQPDSVFDAACGLNPLCLGARGYRNVTAVDIHGGLIRLINDWAEAAGWSVRAQCADLSLSLPTTHFSLVFFMKLLPVLETDEKGAAARVLSSLDADRLVVTFPTRSLGGRNAGMEAHYSEWFESILPETLLISDAFTLGSEKVYFISRRTV